MVSDKFRRQLRQESDQWQTDGLITASQYQQLAQRYQFEALETSARNRFIVILIGLGSVLLGLGVITFVAANWQAIPRNLRVMLLLTLFVGVNAGGFYLWKQPLASLNNQERWPQRLGQGLLLLGALILGANMALMGQMFHRGGSPYELCLMWGLGVVLMAYSLRLTSLGILAGLLMGIGYWLGVQEVFTGGVLPGLRLMMQYMPLLALALFIPLAYWCRSKAIFVMGGIATLTSLEVVVLDLQGLLGAPGPALALAFALPAFLLWPYDDTLGRWLMRQPVSAEISRPFRPLARTLAMVIFCGQLYFLSFHWSWQNWQPMPAVSAQIPHLFSTGLPLLINPNILLLTALGLISWVYLGWPQRSGQRLWRLDLTSTLVWLFITIGAGLTLWNWTVDPIVALATFSVNVLLFILASGFMREGLAQGQRRMFWYGLLLLTLQILSRMLEYNTNLMFKALVFVLCGVGVIVIGLWFERYVNTLEHRPPLLPPLAEENQS